MTTMKLEEVPAEAVLVHTGEECKHCGGSINWRATIGEDGHTVNPVCCHRCRARGATGKEVEA